MPPGAERLPFRESFLLKGHAAVAAVKHSEGLVEEQSLGGVTDGRQLWSRPSENHAWVEVSFECQTNQTGRLTARMVHSHDYGIYRVLLDSNPVGEFDLYVETS